MDYQHFPQLGAANLQVYTTPGNWTLWDKPRNASMCMIIAMSGGSGGGGGFVGAAGAIRGGGGGGGSSATQRLIIPAMLLPAQLYILVGAGGLGVSSGNGGSGGQTYVSLKPGGTGVGDLVMQGSLAVPVGGVTGTVTTAGGGGAAGTIPLVTTNVFTTGGNWNATVGLIGAAAGAVTGAIGVATAARNGTLCCPGAGGASMAAANTENAGGIVTGIGLIPSIEGGTAGATAGGTSMGRNGLTLWEPFMATGGSGGGANTATAGKNTTGGNGSFGSGGGGGGACSSGLGATAAGGNGGPGLVIIACW